jgi:hypothetical protein
VFGFENMVTTTQGTTWKGVTVPKEQRACHGSDPLCAFIGANPATGSIPAAQEMQLNLLKGSSLLREVAARIWGPEAVLITKEVIMAACERMNKRATANLLNTVRTVTINGADFADDDARMSHRQLICESPAQSFPHHGMKYQALLLDRVNTHTMDEQERDEMICFAAAFHDTDALYEEAKASYKSGSSNRQQAWELYDKGTKMLRRLKPGKL